MVKKTNFKNKKKKEKKIGRKARDSEEAGEELMTKI